MVCDEFEARGLRRPSERACPVGLKIPPLCFTQSSWLHTHAHRCVEECLRSQKLKTDRLIGFNCPRGSGKYQPEGMLPCKGRIDSTHKLYPSKKKVVPVIVPLPAYVKPTPNPPKPKPVSANTMFRVIG